MQNSTSLFIYAEAAQSYVDVLSNVGEKSILVWNKQKNW